ncbi:hypothetical protein NXX56_29265 [Bacteroides thetaiotaomicron]|nr:hypothetical protein [Bacteroides thetaiotaomicron]
MKGNKAKGKSREARDINLAPLTTSRRKSSNITSAFPDQRGIDTWLRWCATPIRESGSEYETLLKAFDRENAVLQKRVGKDRVMATYRARTGKKPCSRLYQVVYRRQLICPCWNLPRFHHGVLAAYPDWAVDLRNGLIMGQNCMWLKGVVMKAHYNGLIPRNQLFIQLHISP